MRLHVTYAGGTIGMVDSPEGLRPGADLQGWFGSQLEGIELASNISMSTLDPLIDSSEATPEDWQAIIDDITAHADEADAFLVLHARTRWPTRLRPCPTRWRAWASRSS